MTDPSLWGEAGSQIIWSWYMARAAYAAIITAIVVTIGAGIIGALVWLLRRAPQ